MKPQTRCSLVAIALLFTGIAPAFAEVTTTPQTTTTTTTTSTTGTTTPTLNKGQTDIATSLAKAQLAQYGITDPTPAQMNAALNGGTITAVGTGTGTGTQTIVLKGILTQRAAGQGWGQIANGMGIKLGTAVSAMKSNHHATESKVHGKHITTAAGTSEGVYSQQGKPRSGTVTTAGGKIESGRQEHGKRYGAGIVTAGGGSPVTVHRSQHQSGQVGAGIVTASSGGSGGQGHGHSDGGAKGKSGK